MSDGCRDDLLSPLSTMRCISPRSQASQQRQARLARCPPSAACQPWRRVSADTGLRLDMAAAGVRIVLAVRTPRAGVRAGVAATAAPCRCSRVLPPTVSGVLGLLDNAGTQSISWHAGRERFHYVTLVSTACQCSARPALPLAAALQPSGCHITVSNLMLLSAVTCVPQPRRAGRRCGRRPRARTRRPAPGPGAPGQAAAPCHARPAWWRCTGSAATRWRTGPRPLECRTMCRYAHVQAMRALQAAWPLSRLPLSARRCPAHPSTKHQYSPPYHNSINGRPHAKEQPQMGTLT